MKSRFLLAFIFLLNTISANAQSNLKYSSFNAHSHNDYEQDIPFFKAYYQHFGSIEADVILKNDSLFVGHNQAGIRSDHTLASLYLNPLVGQITKNKDKLFPESDQTIQLLIDLKTESRETMAALVKELQKYKTILQPAGPVKIVISGNTPPVSEFEKYPDFISFDGRPEINYTSVQLSRIGLISQSFKKYTNWNGKGSLTEKEKNDLQKVINRVHGQGKKIRFWETPDHINAWKMLMNLNIDYINTDKVEELGNYLKNRVASEYTFTKPYEPYKPTYQNNDSNSEVKNIILLIGDGMGLTQIYSGLTANQGNLNLTRFLNIGFSRTNASDSYITDSAAGATAMATGQKTRNRAIGVDSNFVAISNLPERIKPLRIKTGLISAGSITDATPAAFYGHQSYRELEKEIAHDYLKSPVEIMIGGGASLFKEEKIADSLQMKGIHFSSEWADLTNIKAPFVLLDDSKTVSVEKGRGDFLASAFTKTYKSLQQNREGFFIMAEGAQIDYSGHANIVSYVVTEMLDFDKLVGEALKFADSNGKTLVIVTADHETGGLTLLDGNIKKGYVDGHFSTNDHTAVMVPVFAYGPHSLDFRGVYHNTEIYYRILNIFQKYHKSK